MSDPLQAYYAEVRAAEDEYFNLHCRDGGPIGVSMWSANSELLRQIDDRHGVRPDDPRSTPSPPIRPSGIKSIMSGPRCARQGSGTAPTSTKTPDGTNGRPNGARTRIADCLARHFPGLNGLHPRTIDSIPKLWAYITEYLSGILERHHHMYPAPAGARPTACDENVRQVYTLLHELKVPWRPAAVPCSNATGGAGPTEANRKPAGA